MVWFRPLLPREQPEVGVSAGKCLVSIVPMLRRLRLCIVQQIAPVITRCQAIEDQVAQVVAPLYPVF